MTVQARFRDSLREYVPKWLSDRPGANVGFRVLWSIAKTLDELAEVGVQGVQAAWPGLGTPTALPMIGRARGIVQGQTETNDHYAARLRGWLEAWSGDRTLGLALQIHEWLGNNPRVRVVSRSGNWVTVNADGTIVRNVAAFDWDSVSHPERNIAAAPWWSDEWVIVYPTQWALRPGTLGGLTGDDGYGIGHLVPHSDVYALRGIIDDWKGAHAKVRAVIWTSDASLFDPTNPGSLPNGNWGAWGTTGNGARAKSDRNLTTCRYWEPWRDDP